MINNRGITRTYRRTRARTHLRTLRRLRNMGLTCSSSIVPSENHGENDGGLRNYWADLRKHHRHGMKAQVTPNIPNLFTPAANFLTNLLNTKSQVNLNILNILTSSYPHTCARTREGLIHSRWTS